MGVNMVGSARVFAAIMVSGMIIAATGLGLQTDEKKATDVVTGIVFGDVIVSPIGGVDGNLTALDIRHRDRGRSARTAYTTYHADFLAGHPQRLQGCFGRVWQMRTGDFTFVGPGGGGRAPGVDRLRSWFGRVEKTRGYCRDRG
jgi:hypothetical protein